MTPISFLCMVTFRFLLFYAKGSIQSSIPELFAGPPPDMHDVLRHRKNCSKKQNWGQ